MNSGMRMKLFLFIFTWLIMGVVLVMADIPQKIELTAVFNYNNNPITGNQTVTVRLNYEGEEAPFYKEVITDVYFDYGVAKLVIGGPDLLNSHFDNPNIVVSISVLQSQLVFPIHSVPYTIRAKESNMARRVDNEAIIKFLEDKRRVGVNIMTPEVTLDVGGVLVLNNIQDTDAKDDGVLFWDGSKNEFFAYRDNQPVSLSWIPKEEVKTKWSGNLNQNLIWSPKAVGIGAAPNDDMGLRVGGQTAFSHSVYVDGNINLLVHAKLKTGHGFDANGHLTVPAINNESFGGNQWNVGGTGDIRFTGRLIGRAAPGLVGLNQFKSKVFTNAHFEPNVIDAVNIKPNAILPYHLANESISTSHMKLGQVTIDFIQDYAITNDHIVDGSIQSHHMKKNQVSSANIKLNTFERSKFQSNIVHGGHIVDAEIRSDKIELNAINQSHFNQTVPFVTSEKIKNGTLTGQHVPLNSIAMDNLATVFTVSQGGTGQTEFQNHGMIYSTVNSTYANDAFFIENGRWGVGVVPQPDVLLHVADTDNAAVSLVSNGLDAQSQSSATLTLKNQTQSWQFTVAEKGNFTVFSGGQPAMTLARSGVDGSAQGWGVGIGTQNPTEALSLTGPLVIGESVCSTCPSGSIRYQDGQFSVQVDGSWAPITSGSLSQRQLEGNNMDVLQQSSVVHAENSTLSGNRLLVLSAEESMINGEFLGSAQIQSSRLQGRMGHGSMLTAASVQLNHGDAALLTDMVGRLSSSMVSVADTATVNLVDTTAGLVNNAAITANRSLARLISTSNVHLKWSQAMGINFSTLTATQSEASFLTQSNLNLDNSTARYLTHVTGQLGTSMAERLSTVDVRVEESQLVNVTNSSLNGQGVLIFGGDAHAVHANYPVVLSGDSHTILGDRSVVMGGRSRALHKDVILMNASSKPLTSDRPGQLKIQADDAIHIQFSSDLGVSMSDATGGWSVVSDETLKTAKIPVDPKHILNKVRQLPVHYWQYKTQENVTHIGPTAQDFYSLFEYGNSNKIIHSIDADGVLLASVKGVQLRLLEMEQLFLKDESHLTAQINDVRDTVTRIQELQQRSQQLSATLDLYAQLMNQLESDYTHQKQMVAYVENQVNRWTMYRRLSRPFKGDGFVGIIAIVAVGMGVGSVLFKWRRL
jgi:hypothetical protein